MLESVCAELEPAGMSLGTADCSWRTKWGRQKLKPSTEPQPMCSSIKSLLCQKPHPEACVVWVFCFVLVFFLNGVLFLKRNASVHGKLPMELQGAASAGRAPGAARCGAGAGG